jgi:glutamate dehydrogenase (NAD(P)+)
MRASTSMCVGSDCYFEWVQANQSYWWSEAEVNQRLVNRMTRAWCDVIEIYDQTQAHPSTRRSAKTSETSCSTARTTDGAALAASHPSMLPRPRCPAHGG